MEETCLQSPEQCSRNVKWRLLCSILVWCRKVKIVFYLPRWFWNQLTEEPIPSSLQTPQHKNVHVQPTSIPPQCLCKETSLSPDLGCKYPISGILCSPPDPGEQLHSVPRLQMWAPGQSAAQTCWADRESFLSAAPLLEHPDKCCGWEVWEEKLSPRRMKRWLKLCLTFPINGKIKLSAAEIAATAMWLVCVFSVS